MAWYRAGTVSVTNGSAVVTGANTDFVSNTQQGEAFLGPDGRVYEIATVVSATQVILGSTYQGATAGGQGFAISPTSSFARDLALGAAQLLNTFAAVRDGVGAGIFPDGSTAAPAFRFAADQDTGIRRFDANALSLVTGGVDRVTIGAGGRVRVSTKESDGTVASILTLFGDVAGASEARMDFGTPAQPYNGSLGVRTLSATDSEMTATVNAGVSGTARFRLYANAAGAASSRLQFGSAANPNAGAISVVTIGADAGVMVLETSGVECARFDNVGNMLVGTTSGSSHTITRSVSAGAPILLVAGVGAAAGAAAIFGGVDQAGAYGANAENAALKVGSNATGRSIATTGTINASGADYAEYMTKGDGCGTIAKGDVCGVDRAGHLTRTWADAIVFKIKSTDPNLVGGDNWAAHLGPRPEQPVRGETTTDDEHAQAIAQYDSDLAVFETAIEEARCAVDRMAYCGRVPVNFAGACEPGDYLVAIANGGGIGLKAVAEADITFADYRRRVGRVLSIGEDSRPIVDVMQG